MQKIFELKGEDWMKGTSTQMSFPFGGIFKRATNFDPFNKMGVAKPSTTPTSVTLGTTPYFLTTFNLSGSGYIYAHTDTKLYKILAESPYTVTDMTSSVTVEDYIVGAIAWKNKYCYMVKTNLGSHTAKSANLTDLSGPANLYASGGFNTDTIHRRKFYEGPNGVLYITDQLYIKGLSAPGGTLTDAFALPQTSMYTARDITDDGRYLIFVADDQVPSSSSVDDPAVRVTGSYNIKVFFWDLFNLRTTADVIWTFQDSYVIGCRYFDGITYVFTPTGIYSCTLTSAPKLVFSFLGNTTITNTPFLPQQILAYAGQLYFAESRNTGSYINAYGNKLAGKKIYSSPFYSQGTTDKHHTALTSSNGRILAATNEPKLYFHNDGGATGNTTITTVPVRLGGTYTFDYAKIVLESPLSSGQTVTMSILTANDEVISDTQTAYFSQGAKKTFIFRAKPLTGGVSLFEDMYLNIILEGATLSRVAIYGTPKDDSSQDI